MNGPLSHTIWCPHCLNYFSPRPRCLQCGRVTKTPLEQCGHCLAEQPLWHRLYCLGDYEPPLSRYISGLKYHGKFYYANDLSFLLAQQITSPAPLLIPVPLHWRRYLSRGYNQSSVLAHYLGRHLKGSSRVTERLFKRIRSTPAQQGLDKQQRQKNLQDAFTLNTYSCPAHVAIVDDVVTTGTTVQQLCKLLLHIGVKKIDIYCICRTADPS